MCEGSAQAHLWEGPPAPPASEDWAYLAGFIDGEGHIGIGNKTNTFGIVRLELWNYDRDVMEWIHEMFGGRWSQTARRGRQKGDPIRIGWYGRRATPILRGILPYLRTVRRKRAELALQFNTLLLRQGNGRGVSMPSDCAEARQGLYEEMRETYGNGIS